MGYDTGLKVGEHACTIDKCTADHSEPKQHIEGNASGAAVSAPIFHVGRYTGGRLSELRSYLDLQQARAEYERLAG